MKGQKALFSKESDDWETPKNLLYTLQSKYGVMYDPCPVSFEKDALKEDWETKNFINPPYSKIKEFVKKGTEELQKRACLNVWLLPARTDTKWFHEYFYKKPNVEIEFIKGRLKFGKSKNSAPFPSMIVIQRMRGA